MNRLFYTISAITIMFALYFGYRSFFTKTSLKVKEHGHIEKIFPDIYFVMGTNKTVHDGVELQHSCSMVIVRDGNELTLINTIKLTAEGLKELDALGIVKNVVRIGAFHGKNDAFYIDRYDAKFWALEGMVDQHGKHTDVVLTADGPTPFPRCTVITFETSKHPEAMLYIDTNDGILVTCDSIKNWIEADEYFSPETTKLYREQGQFGMAQLSSIWLKACDTKRSDFDKLESISFKHLISAHGNPLLNNAYDHIKTSLDSVKFST